MFSDKYTLNFNYLPFWGKIGKEKEKRPILYFFIYSHIE